MKYKYHTHEYVFVQDKDYSAVACENISPGTVPVQRVAGT